MLSRSLGGVCGGMAVVTGKPWRPLLDAFTVFEEGGTHSEEDAVTTLVCDRGVGGGAGGSWRGLSDMVESSAEEVRG